LQRQRDAHHVPVDVHFAKRSLAGTFEFLAQAQRNECVLFHCAAGMDRTGMVAMLLLGLAEVPREEILADYCYSFANKDRVDATVHEYVQNVQAERPPQSAFESYLLYTRLEAIATVYDTPIAHHGSVRSYLESCKVPQAHLEAVLAHLVKV
jgi:protein-tyrosine phosphatase